MALNVKQHIRRHITNLKGQCHQKIDMVLLYAYKQWIFNCFPLFKIFRQTEMLNIYIVLLEILFPD